MFNRIVVGFDGSKGATEAIAKAASLARLCDAELTVLTIYRHHSLLEASFSMSPPGISGNMDDSMRDHAQEVAEAGRVVATEAGAPRVRAFTRRGQPARGIVGFAREHGSDLIVVGCRGLGSVEGFLLGSVSHKVSGLAECPVLVV